jgi:glycosyltransferase involved in cell wall biosynthesis
MTRGVSLAQWHSQGVFEREAALYRALRPHLGGLSIVTYGDERDLSFEAVLPGIDILPNRWGLPVPLYAAALPWLHGSHLAGAGLLKTNQLKGAEVALAVRKRTGAPLVARCGYLWSLAAGQFRDGLRGGLNHAEAVRTERRAFATAEAVSVTTAAMRRYVVQEYQVPEAKISVIPNYVLDAFFEGETGDAQNSRQILFVGRLEEDKAPGMAIEAARGLDAPVTLIGRGSLQAALARQAAQAGVPAEFIPAVPHRELPARMRAAGLFVLPSPREGHPKTLLEAMAAGLPVIGRDAPGIRELIRHGETGLLAQGDAASFRDAAARLLADSELRQRLGWNARAFAREHFAFDKVLAAELALLRRVVEGGPSAA